MELQHEEAIQGDANVSHLFVTVVDVTRSVVS